VDAWGDESAKYDFSKPTGFSEQTGHFTQLVWKATTDVGCGVANCSADDADDGADGKAVGWFLVCEYWPVGNVEGDHNEYFEENVDRSISQAPGFKQTNSLGVCLTLALGVTLMHLL
jgi:Cysteine-rich secretory protein family